MLPKLFFVHFRDSTFVAELNGKPVGFVSGFWSQTYPDEAYIHFVGVDPQTRGQGVGRLLYERFFAAAEQAGRRIVRCVTSPTNKTSIAFHQQLGFTLETGDGQVDGVPVKKGYDGRGGDRVLFVKCSPSPDPTH